MKPENVRKEPRNWLPVIMLVAFIFSVAAASCISTVVWPIVIHR